MPMSGARWKVLAESQFPWEQGALAFIRERLPDHEPYRAWANFEFIAEDGSINEVDLLVVTPKGFFLVEIKSRPGTVEGDAGTWVWHHQGKSFSYDNPLLLANRKAKRLAALLRRQKALRKIRCPFIEARIFLSAEDLTCKLPPYLMEHVHLRDQAPANGHDGRPGIVAALTRWIPGGPDDPGPRRVDRPTAKAIARALDEPGIRASQRSRRVGDYVLGKLLGEGSGYQDWEATHCSLPEVKRRVRLYPVALGASAEQRQTLRRAAEREFRILEGIHHPGILRPVDYCEHERGPVLLFDWLPHAERLNHYLRDKGGSLDVNARIYLLRQIAEALRYAHAKRLVHRALSPQTILITDPDSALPHIRIFNWQTGERAATTGGTAPSVSGTVHPEELVESMTRVYMAPEVEAGAEAAGEHADVFSLGAIAYHLFTGQPPATSVVELRAKLREAKGLSIAAVCDGAPQSLEELVRYSTHPEVPSRLDTAEGFLALLDDVEEELTRPDEEAVVDPLDAKINDRLEGGFTVLKHLGKGSSALALLVQRGEAQAVLKVALDSRHNERLRAEGEVLRKLRHQHVVALHDVLEIGGRVAFLMEKAGDETLAHRLRAEGRLHIDLLQRFGEDLLEAVTYLEEQGIAHRDIKPDNIGIRPAGKSDTLHLVLLDFSLARTPPEDIRAGTRHYLDPFLCLRKPPRWDLHAERFAAAVTLYEMATGTLPVWGDGQSDPAMLDCEVTLSPELFDPDLREPMSEFFAKALRREAAERFDNAREMLRAWRRIFEAAERRLIEKETGVLDYDEAVAGASLDTQLAALPLSTRALNGLERLNVTTVRDLLAVPVADVFRLRGVGHKTRREIGKMVAALARRFPKPVQRPQRERGPEVGEELAAASVDRLAGFLLPSRRVDQTAVRVVEMLLGLDDESALPLWPSQTAIAEKFGITRARVHQIVANARQRWSKAPGFAQLRSDVRVVLDAHGGVMTAGEIASGVLAARGSARAEPLRSRQAMAVVRAAVEAERTLSEPRFFVRRRDQRTLIAVDHALADYAERLGDKADELAMIEPLLAPARVVEELRGVRAPQGCQLSDSRLVQLAAAASHGAAVSSRLELYPRGMDARRAVRLAYGALVGPQRLTADEIRERVRLRYPAAEGLPERPLLDELIRDAGGDLEWSDGAYRSRRWLSTITPGTSPTTRLPTEAGAQPPVTPEVAEAREFEARLQRAAERGGFLALTVAPRNMQLAAQTLRSHFPVEEISFEAVLLRHMRAVAVEAGADWNVVLRADAAPRPSRDWQLLLRVVRRAAARVEQQLCTATRTILLTYPGLLARYDLIDLLERLREAVAHRDGLPGLWLLVPAGSPGTMPAIDGIEVPVITAGQWTPIPEAWLRNVHRASGGEGVRPSQAPAPERAG